MRIKKIKNSGFTLIEILMVIVLVGIIATIVAMLVYEGAKSYGEIDKLRDLSTQGRLAFERMAREIRLVRCTTVGTSCTPTTSDITAMTATEFRFNNTRNEGRGFRLAGSTVNLRQGSGAGDPEDPLVDNVSDLTFEYFKSDGTTATAVQDVWTIAVSLTLSSGARSVSFKVRVHPRGFR